MRNLILRNTGNTLRVEYKVDMLTDTQENFTIMETIGLSDAEAIEGLDFRELTDSLSSFKTFATNNNLILDLIDVSGNATTELIGSPTALDISDSGALTAGSIAIAEIVDIIQRADSSADLNNKYFVISSPENRGNLLNEDTTYYVWFDVDSAGVDPKPVIAGSAGQAIGLKVSISADATDATVAAAVDTVLDALSDFGVSTSTKTNTVTMATKGAIANVIDGNIGGLFAPTVTTAGVDNAYSETLTVVGGNGTKSFAVTSGALPSGLTLNAATGVISGVPQTVENPTFEITVTDAFGVTSVQAGLSIDIS